MVIREALKKYPPRIFPRLKNEHVSSVKILNSLHYAPTWITGIITSNFPSETLTRG
jgi:hypothetical protein